jgi:hypothetical protein
MGMNDTWNDHGGYMSHARSRQRAAVRLVALCLLLSGTLTAGAQVPPEAEYHDAHFHLSNYIQEGTEIRDYMKIMGNRVGRSTLFGIPLQQTWSYENSGDFAPTYYLHTDAPLYYYSFTDAQIAMAYRSLQPEQQARLDPMITGFNPADMYGVDHIKRVLLTFPGVFSGIGEFSIHKEFVSSKVAGDVASLTDPALDRILAFAGEAGLVVLFHNDLDVPFAKAGAEPVYLGQMLELLRRHPGTKIIWAHVGLGRVVHPVQNQAAVGAAERSPSQMKIVEAVLSDPSLAHVHFDISWDEVAKYVVASPESLHNTATILNRYPDRILFGTDEVAPPGPEKYFGIYEKYQPLWNALTPDARHAVLKENYERLFDEARIKVRAWERANAKQ